MSKRKGLTSEEKLKVLKLRADGLGYGTIARELDVSSDQVRDYTRTKAAQALAGRNDITLADIAEKNVNPPKEFNCKNCNRKYFKNDSDIKSTVYCSQSCKEYSEEKKKQDVIQRKTKACARCGKKFVAHNGMQKYCSDECKLFELTCEYCGISFRSVRENQRACGHSCASILVKNGGLSRVQRVEAIKLRNEGRSYGEIVEEVGADSRQQVRSFLKTKEAINLGLDIDKRPMTGNGKTQSYEAREEHFGNLFNSLHPTFKYHSEYKNATEMFKCECLECGHIQERSAEIVRPSRTDYNLQCDGCLENEREKAKAIKLLRRQLRKVTTAKREEESRLGYLESLEGHVCKECNVTFTATSLGKKYCSDVCMKKNGHRNKHVRRRMRARANGKVDTTIGLGKLIVRDSNTCYLCGDDCNENDCVITDEGHFIAGASYPSIDHVIPIVKGGTHTWDNIKLAHHRCNSLKSDNEHIYTDEGQMVLVLR